MKLLAETGEGRRLSLKLAFCRPIAGSKSKAISFQLDSYVNLIWYPLSGGAAWTI